MMQAVDIPFTMGLGQQIDPKLARLMPNGVFKRLENVRVRKDGRIGKRFGSFSVTKPSGTPAALWSAGEQSLVLSDAGRLHSRYGTLASPLWADVGLVEAWVPLNTFGVAGPARGDAKSCASAYVNGFVCIVWALDIEGNNTEIHAAILNEATGTFVSETVLAVIATATAGHVRVAVLSSTQFVAVWQDNTALRHSIFSTSSPGSGWGSPVTLAATLGSASMSFDVDDDQSSGSYLLVWQSTTTALVVGRISAAGATSASQTIATGAVDAHPATVAHCTERIYVAWHQETTGAIRTTSCNTALSATAALVTIETDTENYSRPAICRLSATSAQVFWSSQDAQGVGQTRSASVTDASVASAVSRWRNTYLASKPWFVNGYPHAWVKTSTLEDSQKTYQLLSSQNAQPGPSRAPTLLSFAETSARQSQYYFSKVYASSSGYIWTPLVRSGFEALNGTAADRPLALQFDRQTQRPAVTVNGCLYVAGGSLTIYDGKRAFENGFAWYPKITRTIKAAGGSLTASSTYQYVAVYEYIDAKGQIHRSQPSDPVEVVLSAGEQQVTVEFEPLMFSRRFFVTAEYEARAAVHIYRTLSNGSVFYRITSETTAPEASGNTTTAYNDQTADGLIAVNPVLYTQGGPLPHMTAPASRYIAASATRVALGGLSDSTLVLVSKLLVPEEPVQFADHDAFRVHVPEAVTAIHYLDDVLVVFTERGIYLVAGDGPDDTGNGLFSEPRRLPSNGGCIDWRSVLEIPAGLVFQGERGLYLLPRGFGAPVLMSGIEDELAAYPVVTSATLTHTETESVARWTVQNGAGSAGRVLVLDLRTNQWSVDSYAGAALDLSATWPDGWAAVDSAGELIHEADSTATSPYGEYPEPDDNYVSSVLELGDLRPFGSQGRGLVRLLNFLGERRASSASSVSLKIEISYDAGVTYSDNAQWTLTGDTGAQVVKEWGLPRINVDELRVRLSDINPMGAGEGSNEGIVYNGLTLQVEPRRGARRFASGDRA